VSLTQFPGDPGSIKSYGTKYEQLAQTILEVSQKLTALVNDESAAGDSVAQLRENARNAASDVKKAQSRYHETALALIEFGTDLQDAMSKASTAISNHSNGASALSTLNYRRRNLEEDRASAMAAGADQATIDDINSDIRAVDREIDNVEYAIANAQSLYDAAAVDREEAIAEAITRIQGALDELNDTAADYVRAAFESIAEFFAAIAKWIDEVLLPLLEDILVVIGTVLLILVALAFLLQVLFALGAVGMLVMALAAALAAYLIVETVKTLAPTPPVTLIDPTTLPSGSRSPECGDYLSTSDQGGDLLEDRYLDEMGGADSTLIEVVKVVDEDGTVRWRVILPSTQDWEFMNGFPAGIEHWVPKDDRGALNDLGSNALLMVTPWLQAAYEQAVRQAMTDAGIKPGEEIMMVGWSQGGILAGAFASDMNDEFNVTAIAVAGAPIDHMPIPSTVSVLSVQHDGDIVHDLDFKTPPPPNSANWYTVSTTVQNAGGEPMEVHDSASYAATIDNALRYAQPGSDLDAVKQKQSVFYGGTETPFVFQTSE